MTDVTVSEARAHFSDLVDQVRVGREPIYVTRHGKKVAAVVDAMWLDTVIESLEDLQDIRAAEAAREELKHTPAVPWDEVKADLGLT